MEQQHATTEAVYAYRNWRLEEIPQLTKPEPLTAW